MTIHLSPGARPEAVVLLCNEPTMRPAGEKACMHLPTRPKGPSDNEAADLPPGIGVGAFRLNTATQDGARQLQLS